MAQLPAGISREIARFAASTSWEGLPPEVRRQAVRTHLNYVGCAVGGSNTLTVDLGVRAAQAMGANGDVPVFGRSERFDMVNAAMLSCLGSAAQSFDDTHLRTITHPTGPVAAAAMVCVHAVSRRGRQIHGRDFLLSLVLGIEIECRLSNAIKLDGQGADIGWYMTGVSGGVGAAVAAGHLLGLDEDRMVAAIGLAAAQACGVRSTHGSMATAYVPAIACRNGLTSAWLATTGFTGSEATIDGRNGLFQVMSPLANAGPIRDGLGSSFEMPTNAYKPYPCGIVIHPAIDACLALAMKPEILPGSIERVDLRVHPETLKLCWRKLPDTELDAQVSVYHWAAAALVRRAAGVREGETSSVLDPALRSMQESIHAVADSTLESDQARATATLKDGRVVEVFIEHATGSAANPMSDAQLEAKFRSMCRRVLDESQTEQLLGACKSLDSAPDPLEVLRLGSMT